MHFFQKLFLPAILLFSVSVSAQSSRPHGVLEVSANGHFLQFEDGTPFFWLGDTGWDLFFRLTMPQIKTYLENRAAKGFNVIQAVALAEPGGLDHTNRYGRRPLIDRDPTRPNEEYFSLIDSTVRLAARLHLFIGLLPTWGDKVTKLWGEGPVVFDSVNAFVYGRWLGHRYRHDKNVIWIIGGDRPALNDKTDWRPVWRAMARGIRQGAGEKVLITYHPSGESSSSRFWTGDSTLDLNMLQSGHRKRDFPVWAMIRHDYHLQPAKPVLDGEPNYEDHPVNWKAENGYFRAYDVRKQLYRSVFSGGCGVTYGHNSIFQFYGPGDEKRNFADRYWMEAMDRPGAFQAGYLKKLILSRPALTRIPDQSFLPNGQAEEDPEYAVAFRDLGGSYAMIYLPVGRRVEIDLSPLNAHRIKAWWFDPRTGKTQKAGKFKKEPTRWFTPPALGSEEDWVLVLDDAGKKYRKPGVGDFGG